MAEVRETHDLIGSDKVDGTNVYGTDRQKIGYIERVMIGKTSGKVSYAVLSFGGFLGMGDDHYPLPWSSLNYNTELEGYQVNITEQQLKEPRNIPVTTIGTGRTKSGDVRCMITTDSLGFIDNLANSLRAVYLNPARMAGFS